MGNTKTGTGAQLTVAPPNTSNTSMRVTECFNLRPDSTDASILRPVGSPVLIAGAEYRPLGLMQDKLIVADGSDILWLDADADSECTPELIASLSAEPLYVVDCGQSTMVMTDAGPYLLDRATDGRPRGLGMLSDIRPGLMIQAIEDAPLTETIASTSIANAGKATLATYQLLSDRADAAGLYCQPVLAQCRVIGADGSVLYRTPPVLVASSMGGQLAEALRFEYSNSEEESVSGRTLQMFTYRLRVTLTDTLPAAVALAARRVELWVSPQFHAVDIDGTAQVSEARSGSDSWVTVRLPVSPYAVSDQSPAGAIHVLRRVYAGFDEVAQQAASLAVDLSQPFSRDIDAPGAVAWSASFKALSTLMESAVEPLSEAEALTRLPRCFSATGAEVNSGAILWHGIKALPFGGYTPVSFAATIADTPSIMTVRVDFDNGECLVSTFTSEVTPLSFNPVLSYPDPHAVRLAISVKPTDSQVSAYALAVELSPEASGRAALYIHNGAVPFTADDIAECTSDFEAETSYSAPAYDAIIMASYCTDPFSMITSASSAGSVIAASRLPCNSYGGTRPPRFVLFTDSGTHFVSLTSGVLSSWLADARTVATADAIAAGRNGVAAIYGNRVAWITNSGITDIDGEYDAELTGYDPLRNELILARRDDNEAIHIDSKGCHYSTELKYPQHWFASGSHIFATTTDGLVSVCLRNSDSAVTVRWKAWVNTADTQCRPTLPDAILWRVKGANLSGSLDVERAWLTNQTPAPALIHRLKVTGKLSSPLVAKLHGHPAYQLRLATDMNLSADAAMATPLILKRKSN